LKGIILGIKKKRMTNKEKESDKIRKIKERKEDLSSHPSS
jgi:hypothetical protein